MTIKELKELINELPDDMEIGLLHGQNLNSTNAYSLFGTLVRKVKARNTRIGVDSQLLIQGRPQKDEDAKVMLIFE